MVSARPARTGSGAATLVLGVALALGAAGCGVVPSAGDEDPPRALVSGAGEGAFVLDDGPGFAGRPVEVLYDAPAGDLSGLDLLVVLPGTGREADLARGEWAEHVRGRDVVLLAPRFPRESYPDPEGYQLGGVVDADGRWLPRDRWTLGLVEELVDRVAADTGARGEDYLLFGHSAGGQLVARLVLLVPDHRARVAVAANPGWWTAVDDGVDFPHGLRGSPVSEATAGHALGSDLVVLLGADDVDPDAPFLDQDPASEAQGEHRLERALSTYLGAREVARDRGQPFRWRLQVVPGVGHSGEGTAAAAAPLLLGRPGESGDRGGRAPG